MLKAVVAQFDAGELITQREVVSSTIDAELTKRAEQFGIILDDISITHLTFGREFTQAVELKQVWKAEVVVHSTYICTPMRSSIPNEVGFLKLIPLMSATQMTKEGESGLSRFKVTAASFGTLQTIENDDGLERSIEDPTLPGQG